jgi:hypothetical protein
MPFRWHASSENEIVQFQKSENSVIFSDGDRSEHPLISSENKAIISFLIIYRKSR